MIRSKSLIQSRIPEHLIETTEQYLARGGVIHKVDAGETGIPVTAPRDLFRQFYFQRDRSAIPLPERK